MGYFVIFYCSTWGAMLAIKAFYPGNHLSYMAEYSYFLADDEQKFMNIKKTEKLSQPS